jgi:hypothetical protein
MNNPANARPASYAVRGFTVPAGASIEVYRAADFLTALSANQGFKVSFDNQPRSDFEAGLTLRTRNGFTLLQIINEADTDLTVRLGFGRGELTDARLTLSGEISTRATEPDVYQTFDPVTIGASLAATVLAADALRREAIIYNAGPGPVLVQGLGSSAGSGLPLAEGGTAVLRTSGAVVVKNNNGAGVTISAGETGFSA